MENVETTEGVVAPEVTTEVSESSEDKWEAAEEAFDSVPEVKAEAEEKVSETHIEPEEPEYLKLDDLRVPHKYKGAVKERLQKVIADFEAKTKSEIESKGQELSQHKEAVLGLVNVFKDLAQTPKDQVTTKMAELIEQYGQSLGLDPSVANNFKVQQQVNQVQQQVQQRATQTIDSIIDQMVVAEDPKVFRESLRGAFDLVGKQTLDQVGMLLKAYHDQYIVPDKTTLQEFRTKAQQSAEAAEFESKRTSWQSATDALAKKYPDFEKHKETLSKMISEDGDLAAARDYLNNKPSDVQARQKFLERIYLVVSRNEAVESAKKPSHGGLPPSQKHISTKSKTGGNWDAVWESQKDDWS